MQMQDRVQWKAMLVPQSRLLCTDICECIECENSRNNPDSDSDDDEVDKD